MAATNPRLSNECTKVIDLYCGRGNWTNQIAASHTDKQVMGVDALPENIDAARSSSRQMKLGNVQFHLSPVEKIISRLPVETRLCIVDPLMIHVVPILTTLPGKREEVLTEFKKLVPLVHAEKGCIECQPVFDTPDVGPFQTELGVNS
jgi:quinol monooxygenase YgiN